MALPLMTVAGATAFTRTSGDISMASSRTRWLAAALLVAVVLAAPHSKLRVADDQTARLLTVLRTRGVHILGHPRGRIWFRWFYPSETPARPTTRVVKVPG